MSKKKANFLKIYYSSPSRYISWTVYVLHQHKKTGRIDPVPLPGAPFSHYYAQENADEGIIIETDVAIKEVNKN